MTLDISSRQTIRQDLEQKLKQTFGKKLSPAELNLCLEASQIIEPQPGKEFWQSSKSEPGIYIVISGKARILDDRNNFLVSIAAGDSWGELTLYPEPSFLPYRVRASSRLKLVYLARSFLERLIEGNSGIGK